MSRDVERLQLALDYGTKTVSVAFRIAQPGDDGQFNEDDIHSVAFKSNSKELPQQVAYSDDGRFYAGEEVNTAINQEQVRINVFRIWKLCLYNEYEKSDTVRDLESRLEALDKTVQELITEHLDYILMRAKSAIKSSLSLTSNAAKIDTLPVQLFLSVPQMWKQPANRVMMEAGKAAGATNVVLVYEPECAAAYATKRMIHDKQLNTGDCMVVADLGGGTADFVSYQFGQSDDAGAAVGLGITGQSEGAMCGSEFVNLNFCLHVEETAARESGSFEAKCEELGLTKKDARDRASDKFEIHKLCFENPDSFLTEYVLINGARGREWVVEVTPEVMCKCFDGVIAQIEGCIDKQLKHLTKAKLLLITGKFGRSPYLLSRLENRYGHRLVIHQECEEGIFPVSFGAFMRFASVKSQGWGRAEQLLIAREEQYNPEDHPDATLNAQGRYPKPDRNIVRASHFGEGFEVVDGRAAAIFTKDIHGQAHHPVVYEYRMLPVDNNGIVPHDDANVKLQVYWTESPIEDHMPMLLGGFGSNLRKEIEKWGSPIIFLIPRDLTARGFQIIEKMTGDGNNLALKRFIKVFFSINVQENGPNLTVWIRLVDSRVHAPHLLKNKHVPYIDHIHETVFETAYNPIPRSELQFSVEKNKRHDRTRDRATKRRRVNDGQ